MCELLSRTEVLALQIRLFELRQRRKDKFFRDFGSQYLLRPINCGPNDTVSNLHGLNPLGSYSNDLNGTRLAALGKTTTTINYATNS